MADILFEISDINEVIIKARKDNNLYTSISQLEDDTAKIFDIDKKSSLSQSSSIVDINIPILWNCNSEIINQIIPSVKKLPKLPDIYNHLFDYCNNNKLNIKTYNGFIICGKILDSVSNCIAVPDIFDLYFYDNTSHSKFSNNAFVCDNDSDKDKDNDNIFNIGPFIDIKIHKKVYSSPTEILLSLPKYIHRFCFDCKKLQYYASVMFYLELDRLCGTEFSDIVRANSYFKELNVKISKYGLFHQIVNTIDIDKLMEQTKQNKPDKPDNLDSKDNDYETLDDEGFTPIERALIIYSTLVDPLLLKNMKNIIDILCTFSYRRPPYLFCAMISARQPEVNFNSVYDSLISCTNKYGLALTKYKNKNNQDNSKYTIFDINTYVIRELLYGNNIDNIVDYIKFINYCNFDYNVLLYAKNLLRSVLPKIYHERSAQNIYEIILMSEFTDIFNDIGWNTKLSNNFVRNIVPRLLENLCFSSLLYLVKMHYNIFDFKYSKPLVLFVADSKLNITENDCVKVLKFFYKYSHDFSMDLSDKNGDTFIHRLAINKPELLSSVLNYFGKKITSSSKNKSGDTFIHILTKKKNIEIIRSLIDFVKPILNVQNNNGETPLIIAARMKDEVLFSLFNTYGANKLCRDKYGNTVYHYICMNEMFIGSVIIETENEYGLKPSNYTVLNNYWNFKQ